MLQEAPTSQASTEQTCSGLAELSTDGAAVLLLLTNNPQYNSRSSLHVYHNPQYNISLYIQQSPV